MQRILNRHLWPHTRISHKRTTSTGPARECLDTLRARLTYRSRKRGILETDLLLSSFAKDHLPSMTETELFEYGRLLEEADSDIYSWSAGTRPPPDKWTDSSVLHKLRMYVSNQGKGIRVMPPVP